MQILIDNKESLQVILLCLVCCGVIAEAGRRLHRGSHSYLLMILACSSLIAFFRLGSFSFPHTTWQPESTGASFILELPEDTHYDRIYAVYGEGDNNALESGYQLGFHDIRLYGSNDLEHWEETAVLADTRIYRWSLTDTDRNDRYIKVCSEDPLDTITELGFKAYGEDRFLPVCIHTDPQEDSTYPAALVIDEKDTLCVYPDYRDESYFDEVYHVRNAWEIRASQRMYSHVHPLLGTGIIAWSIRLFGMCPFAWRFPGAVCGILSLLVLYRILVILLKDRSDAALGTFFLSVDFMHMTASRIATLEPFSILFILCMFLFMVRYACADREHTPVKDLLKHLFFSGLFTSLAIAVKWTGCYSAAGLAVIFFSCMIRDHHQLSEDTFRKLYRSIIPGCCVFFLILPAVIYCISYLPTMAFSDGWSLRNVLEQIQYSFHYHASLTAEHPYQSSWYEWLLDLRPVWYYVGHKGEEMRTIACFNNPVISIAGLACLLVCTKKAVIEKDRTSGLIAIGYWSALLPWLLVSRNTFAYHYYPSVLFLCMAMASVLSGHRCAKRIVAGAAVFLFCLYLPVICGFASSASWLRFLEFLPGWYWG